MNKQLYYLLIFVLISCGFSFFYHIDTPPIRIYDEAIYANNALEMALDGDLLVLKVDGKPSLYNTKPPLGIWLQALSLKVFGFNEFAVRFPTALAGLIIIAALFLFSIYSLKNPWIGIIAAFTLVSTGFIRQHVGRTGDLDGVLAMWVSLYTLTYFSLLLDKAFHLNKYLWICGGLVFVAFLTKSTAGLMPLLGLFIATLFSPQRKNILQNSKLYLIGFLLLCGIVLYYTILEGFTSGYQAKAFHAQYKRFFYNTMPWHSQPYWHYLQNWVDRKFFYPFVYFLPFGVIIAFLTKVQRLKKFLLYAYIFCITYFLLISYPTVKIEWYDGLLYPIFSLIIAVIIYETVDLSIDRLAPKINKIRPFSISAIKNVLILLLTISILYLPYKRNISNILGELGPKEYQEREGNFLRTLRKSHPKIKNIHIYQVVKYDEHLLSTQFYRRAYNSKDGYNLSLIDSKDLLSPGDTVLTCHLHKQDSIKQQFETSLLLEILVLGKWKYCQLLVVEN